MPIQNPPRVYDPFRNVGFESGKAYARRCRDGFWDRHAPGQDILDIGFRGGTPHAVPILEGAIGVELNYPGYDGFTLPFADGSIDTVHSSHVLEHVADDIYSLRDWHRVLRTGGTIVCFVPHAHLYERRLTVPPSRWSGEHLRCYTPQTLLRAVEQAFAPNTYRVRHLADCDTGYRYDLSPDQHPEGCLEIELVIERIAPPAWRVEP